MNELEIEALRRGAAQPVRAAQGDHETVARDLAAAFADDPIFQWFLRDDARRGEGRLKLFRLLAGSGLASGEILRPASGGAASIWMPSTALGPSPIWDELRLLPTILAATGFSRLGRLSAMRAAMDKSHPMDREHAYLWFIGVTPEAQGMGVGSRLLAAGLERVDAQRLPAYLESSNPANVPLYRRFGFEVIGQIQPTPDAPVLDAMWREARA